MVIILIEWQVLEKLRSGASRPLGLAASFTTPTIFIRR
jgi:hypothetical protein